MVGISYDSDVVVPNVQLRRHQMDLSQWRSRNVDVSVLRFSVASGWVCLLLVRSSAALRSLVANQPLQLCRSIISK